MVNNWNNLGKRMPFLTPMNGNGTHTTYKNGDDWGTVHGIVFTTSVIETQTNVRQHALAGNTFKYATRINKA